MRCLNEELATSNSYRTVSVGSISPGVTRTAMFTTLSTSEEFPGRAGMKEMDSKGEVHSPEEVARYCAWVVAAMARDEFITQQNDLPFMDKERWAGFDGRAVNV